jgi:preprotein translocase subunit SecY
MNIQSVLYNLPEVRPPTEKRLPFNTKLKWTLIILVAFFVLANIPLYGLGQNSLIRFQQVATILGAEFGSIISLGIGPIVTASIILQLLVGSGILKIDTNTPEGKRYFQGLQKIGVIFFIIFEAMIYVLMGGLQPVSAAYTGILIFQLILGGLAIMFMDEVTTKWGFGSGVSIFIVAGVARTLVTGLVQFIGQSGENCLADFGNTACSGALLVIVQSFINGAPREALVAATVIVVTIAIFLLVVWAQSLKVEIPLSFDRLRGHTIKWPLAFFYASNIPVILVAALLANVQLFGSLLENAFDGPTLIGGFSNGQPVSGLAYWLSSSNLLETIIRGSLQTSQIVQAFTHLIFFMAFSTLFAVFWVKTAGMDASSQAKKIISSGLQIPGFRKDQRILESILARYVMPLTIMGGLAIGALAALTDTLGALVSGTSILLAVMIMYQLYQNVAQQHAVDMHPTLRRMAGE